jgi:hypothetical protein
LFSEGFGLWRSAVKITIKGLDTATAQIQSAVKIGVSNALSVAGARGEVLVKEAIQNPYLGRPPAVATGNLVNSITFQVSQQAGISRALVFAAAPADQYAGYVEAGTGPHFPPPNALLLWVKKKFSLPRRRRSRRSRSRLPWRGRSRSAAFLRSGCSRGHSRSLKAICAWNFPGADRKIDRNDWGRVDRAGSDEIGFSILIWGPGGLPAGLRGGGFRDSRHAAFRGGGYKRIGGEGVHSHPATVTCIERQFY